MSYNVSYVKLKCNPLSINTITFYNDIKMILRNLSYL